MRQTIVAASLALAVIGCVDYSKQVSPRSPQSALFARTGRATVQRTIDDDLAQIADSVPGFGGFYLRGDTMHVYLTNPGVGNRLEAVLRNAPMLRDHHFGAMVVHPGQYDIRVLKEWRDSVRSALGAVDGAVSLDLDEGANRITVGVSSSAVEHAAKLTLSGIRAPMALFKFEVVPPVRLQSYLQDSIRPVIAGIGTADSTRGGCTLGITFNYGPELHAITNSHCTANFWNWDGTNFYNPNWLNQINYIGDEGYDTQGFTGPPCPSLHQCRYAETANLILQASTTLYEIARTEYAGLYSGSIILVPNHFVVMQDNGPPVEPVLGMTIEQMGSAGGWTEGTIDRTCVDYFIEGLSVYPKPDVLCQYTSTAYAHDGDSGSPVFTRTYTNDPFGRERVHWVGIHWGALELPGANSGPLIFSKASYVISESYVSSYGSSY